LRFPYTKFTLQTSFNFCPNYVQEFGLCSVQWQSFKTLEPNEQKSPCYCIMPLFPDVQMAVFPFERELLYSLLMGKEYSIIFPVQYLIYLGQYCLSQVRADTISPICRAILFLIVHAVFPNFLGIRGLHCLYTVFFSPGIQWSVYCLVFSGQYCL
jgi:hypothetical protein